MRFARALSCDAFIPEPAEAHGSTIKVVFGCGMNGSQFVHDLEQALSPEAERRLQLQDGQKSHLSHDPLSPESKLQKVLLGHTTPSLLSSSIVALQKPPLDGKRPQEAALTPHASHGVMGGAGGGGGEHMQYWYSRGALS